MGAYENPETAIDTQSGQHIRSMIGNVANSTSNFIKEFKQKEDEHNKKLGDFQTELLKGANKTGADAIKDPSANVQPAVNEFKGVLSAYSVDALSNDLTKSKNARDAIFTAQTQGKKTLESTGIELPLYIDPIKESVKVSPGMPGAMYSETPDWYRNFAYGLNYNKGSEAVIAFAKKEDGSTDLTDTAIDYSITYPDGSKKPLPLTLNQMRNANKNFPDGEYTIPKMKDNEFMKSLDSIFNVNAKGEIGEGLSKSVFVNAKYTKTGKTPMGQYAKGDKSNKTISAGDYITDTVDRDGLANEPEVVKIASSFIGGMITSNPRGLAMYANDVLLRQFPDAFEKIKDIDDVNSISAIKDKIAVAYTKSLIYQKLPNPTVIKKDAAGEAVYVKNVQEKTEGGSDQNQLPKLTAAQKRDISFVQDRWEKVKNGHEEYPLNEAGTIIYKEDVLYKSIKDPTIPNSPAKLVPLPDSLKKYYGLTK
jgi:hypothetical protein